MTNILILAFHNLARRRLRSLVTAAGVAVAVATLFCLASFQRGYQAGLRAEMDRLGAHLLVVPKGCPYDAASMALHGATWPCYLQDKYLGTVRGTRHVTAAAPVFMTAVDDTASSVGGQVVYCGVDPAICQLKPLWRIQGRFPQESGEILIGSDLAQTRRWQLGQSVALPGVSGQRGRITGILAPTDGADDMFAFMPLPDAQRIFRRPRQMTHILVRLDAAESMDSVVSDLRGCDAGLEMNIVPMTHLFRTIQALVQNTRLLLGCVVLVALLAAGAGVSNSLLMAVVERTREIGVLRAVGASRRDVFALIWTETVLLCLVGGSAGIVLARCGAQAVEAWLRGRLPFAPKDLLIQTEWPVVALCVGGSLLLGTLSGLLPAWRAARLSPAEAIRAAGAA